jgi:hypothetical protein
MRLLSRHRRHVRATAVAAIREAEGDQDQAIALGKKMLRDEPGSIIGALLINIAVSLMVKLIIYFIREYVLKSGIDSIPSDYQESEPGFEGWSETDAE